MGKREENALIFISSSEAQWLAQASLEILMKF